MIERLQIHFLLCIAALVAIGQNPVDDLIVYTSDFEREVLTNPDKKNALELLMACKSPDVSIVSISSKLQAFQNQLRNKKISSKSEEKQIKILFSETHKNFFSRYQEVSNFDKIFTIKEYNCVSATGLYVLLMEEFRIPYVIKETPTHVYAIAYPHTKGIVVESTAPKNGYYSPSEKDIRKAVEALVEFKYYTEEEVKNKGPREIYKDFFFSEDEITLQNLAGLQYHNEMIQQLSEEDFQSALNAGLKSNMLYPSQRTEYLLTVLLEVLLQTSDFSEIKHFAYLAHFANISHEKNETIINNYELTINRLLFKEGKKDIADSLHNYLKAAIQDTTLFSILDFAYCYQQSSYYLQKGNNRKSLEYAIKAYEIDSVDVNVQSILTRSIVLTIGKATGKNEVEKLESFENRFSFLKEDLNFQSYFFELLAFNSSYYFRADDQSNGTYFLNQAMSIADKFGEDIAINKSMGAFAYAEGGAHLFRERKYKKAQALLEEGLKRFPGDPELKVRLEIVLDEN